MKIKDKEFKLSFSFNALCKLEELGVDMFNGGVNKMSPSVVRKMLQAGLCDNHKPEEVEQLFKELKVGDLKDILPQLVEEFNKAF